MTTCGDVIVSWWAGNRYRQRVGGAEEDRTPDLLRARQALSQLSYGPMSADPDKSLVRCESLTKTSNFQLSSLGPAKLVGLGGVEPPTSPLSGVRSNQLSYRPKPASGIPPAAHRQAA